MRRPTLYLDIGSPYAYLAAERAPSLLGTELELQPVLLGAIFKLRGWGSWARGEGRDAGMAEVEARAQRYGLPEMVWPENWPGNSLAADRAALWAKDQGAAEPFIGALFREEFTRGAEIERADTLRAAAGAAGLDPDELLAATQQPEVKDALRRATEQAWELGVQGVPTVRVGEALFYGDDQLEAAAAHARSIADL
jgi:2-hydroxychromene-2-carboxylate isomerase